MISDNEIHAFKKLPITITNLSKELTISNSAASKISQKLIKNGLATKQRNGKSVVIQKEKTIHVQKLEEIIKLFPRLPIEKIVTHSNLLVIALLSHPMKIKELSYIIDISRQGVHKNIKFLTRFGIVLKTKNGYAINSAHYKIHKFAQYYFEYINYQILSNITQDAIILWQNGNEFLIKTNQEIHLTPETAISIFPQYNLPLFSDTKYYFYTKRKLTIADSILHTILIDPSSKSNNYYACLLYQKTQPKDIRDKARLYNLTNHLQTILSFLETHQGKQKYLPTWKEYENIAMQYKVM